MDIRRLNIHEKNLILYALFRLKYPEYPARCLNGGFCFNIGRAVYSCGLDIPDYSFSLEREFRYRGRGLLASLAQSAYVGITEKLNKKTVDGISDYLIDEYNSLTPDKAEYLLGHILRTEGLDAERVAELPTVESLTEQTPVKNQGLIAAIIFVPFIVGLLALLNIPELPVDKATYDYSSAYRVAEDTATGLYGVQDRAENWIIAPAYQSMTELGLQLFSAETDGTFTIMDCNGTELLTGDSAFIYVSNLGSNAVAYTDGDKCGFITRKCRLYAPEFDDIIYMGNDRILLRQGDSFAALTTDGRRISGVPDYALFDRHPLAIPLAIFLSTFLPFIAYTIDRHRNRP